MATLEKAKLQEVSADEAQKELGPEIPVQFNPTSLKLKLSNTTSGGRSRGNQRRQNTGQSSTVLSMDLIFDTADEGTETEPVSVRTKTNEMEKFVLPKKDTSDAPPLLRFQWDELIIVGIVESLEIEFDHFAANGAPLRAKMAVSIKEQKPGYAFEQLDRDSDNASNSDRSDTALDGESAAEFLARQGLSPLAWRGLDVDLSASLSLEAGIEVGFSAGLSVSGGIGLSVGVMAEVGVSLEASLGFGASVVVGTGASAGAAASTSAGLSTSSGGSVKTGSQATKKISGESAGLALSAAGGIQSAIETVKISETRSVVAQTQSAFGLPGQASSLAPGDESRAPLVTDRSGSEGNSSGIVKAAGASSSPPRADPRSISFGYGVPLRPLYAAALSQVQVRLCSRSEVGLRADSGPKFRRQTSTAPWVALPQRDKTRAIADQAESNRQRHPCDYVYHPCDCDE